MSDKNVDINVGTAIEAPTFYKPGTEKAKLGRSLLLFGDPGVGKTSLVKTLLGWEHGKGFVNEPYCAAEEILVINIDAGESVLYHDNKLSVTTYRVEEDNHSLSKFKGLIQHLHENPGHWKFIIIDNMSELEKYFLMSLTKSKELDVPRQKEWGDDAFYMRKYIRDIRNLTYKGVNVVFNFWSMNLPVEGIDQQITVPMVMRSTTMEYIGLVEHTAYMGIGKNGARFLQFESNDRIKCKFRGTGDTEKPVLAQFEKPNLADIMRKLDGIEKQDTKPEEEK